MAERRGAGAKLAGLLESRPTTPPEPEPAEAEDVEAAAAADPGADEAPAPAKGRGGAARKARTVEARAARRIKGRTIYIPDDLWERIIVQSHRKDKTYSEYVVAILERQVPDHRVVRSDQGGADAA